MSDRSQSSSCARSRFIQFRAMVAFSSVVACTLIVSGCAHERPAPIDQRPAAAQFSTPQSELWAFDGVQGKLIRTPHYRLFTTDRDPILIGLLPSFLESNFTRYRTEFTDLPSPAYKLDVFLLRDREQWAALTRQVMGADATAYLSIGRGGFAAGGRSLLWNIGLRDTLALAAHEGWHQYTQRVFRDPLPLWLDEGIATYMEGFRLDPAAPGDSMMSSNPWVNHERFSALQSTADASQLLPLAELLDVSSRDLLAMPPERSLAYYAQAWAFMIFLKHGDQGSHVSALAEALRDASEGRLISRIENRAGAAFSQRSRDERRGSGLILAYISTDIAALDASHRAFIAELLAPGAMDRFVHDRAPTSRLAH